MNPMTIYNHLSLFKRHFDLYYYRTITSKVEIVYEMSNHRLWLIFVLADAQIGVMFNLGIKMFLIDNGIIFLA